MERRETPYDRAGQPGRERLGVLGTWLTLSVGVIITCLSRGVLVGVSEFNSVNH